MKSAIWGVILNRRSQLLRYFCCKLFTMLSFGWSEENTSLVSEMIKQLNSTSRAFEIKEHYNLMFEPHHCVVGRSRHRHFVLSS